MRVIDILTESVLTEAGLTARDFYERGRLDNFIKKLVAKEPFFTVDGEQIEIPATGSEISWLKTQLKTNFDSKDPLARAVQSLEIFPKIGGIRLSSLAKTKEFGGTFSVNSSGKMDTSKANIGPTVEALKAFAIFARLVIRNKATLTAQDVMKVAQMAQKNSSIVYLTNEKTGKPSKNPTTQVTVVRKVPDKNGTVKDEFTLNVSLSTPSFVRAINVTEKDKAAWGHLNGVVKYINSEGDLAKYSRYFANNNKKDPVKIAVIGIELGKVDISSSYTDPVSGEERPLENLTMSIKSEDAPWFHQTSGGKLTGIYQMYQAIGLTDAEVDEDMVTAGYQETGKKNSRAQFQQTVKAVEAIYDLAFDRLGSAMAKLNDKGEADYIHNFLNTLKHNIAGDDKLVYVKFNARGAYSKLKPNMLWHLSEVIELGVNQGTGQRRAIYWIDQKTGKTLMEVRMLINAPNHRITNQFNLGKDFFSLIKESEKIYNVNSTKAAPATTPTTDKQVTQVEPTEPIAKKAVPANIKKSAATAVPTANIDTNPNQSLNRAVPSTNPNDNIPFAT